MQALYNEMMIEISARLKNASKPITSIKEKIKEELLYLRSKRKIITVMMMESMKSEGEHNSLFRIAEAEIKNEMEHASNILESDDKEKRDLFYTHEFFTGFIPILNFVIYEERWCEYFKCNKNKLLDNFIDIFEKTHLMTHIR